MSKRQLCFVCSLIALVISACGSGTPVTPPTVAQPTTNVNRPSPTPQGTTNGITVGYNAASPPFVFKRAGTLTGFDIELISMVAETAGFELEFVENKIWGNIFQELSDGRYDLVISAATGAAERCEANLCSQPYFNAGLALLVANDGAIRSVSDLDETHRVGVQQNTTGESWTRKNSQAELVGFSQPQQAIAALITGDVDAVIHDQPILTQLLENESKSDNLCQVSGLLSDEPYVIMFVKGKLSFWPKLMTF